MRIASLFVPFPIPVCAPAGGGEAHAAVLAPVAFGLAPEAGEDGSGLLGLFPGRSESGMVAAEGAAGLSSPRFGLEGGSGEVIGGLAELRAAAGDVGFGEWLIIRPASREEFSV